MAIKVRPRIIPPIDRSWKNTSLEWEDPTAGERSAVRTKVTKQSKTKSWKDSPLEYADPTAAKRTKPKVKPKKEEDYEIGHKGGGKIMYRSKGGQVFNGNDFVIQANNYKEM